MTFLQIPARDMHCNGSTFFTVWFIEFATSSYSIQIAIMISRAQRREAGFYVLDFQAKIFVFPPVLYISM